jgi:pantetheine-phosphate adenylyltransferase
MKKAIYPGTFDPITKGHLDVIQRATKVCDSLYVAVAGDSNKKPLFSLSDRLKLIREGIKEELPILMDKIEVISFDGLLINYAKENDISLIVRGLRAVSDFEYEFQLASMNSRLAPDIQTVFIPASENRQFIASNMVKEISRLGGDVSQFVTSSVVEALSQKFSD